MIWSTKESSIFRNNRALVDHQIEIEWDSSKGRWVPMAPMIGPFQLRADHDREKFQRKHFDQCTKPGE